MTKLSYVPLLADDLRALGACESQVLLFEQRFPNGATPDDAPRADGLDIEWLLRILDWDAYEAIERPAQEAYEAIRQPALEAYNATTQPAWEAYEAAIQPALEAYEATPQPALKAYEDIQQPAWEAYKVIERPALEAYEAIERPALEAYEAIRQPAWEVRFATIHTASLDALRVLWPVWEE